MATKKLTPAQQEIVDKINNGLKIGYVVYNENTRSERCEYRLYYVNGDNEVLKCDYVNVKIIVNLLDKGIISDDDIKRLN